MWRQHLWTKSILNGAVMGSQLVVQWSVWSSDRAVDWSHGLIPCDCFPPDSMRFLCVRIWLSCVPRSSPHQSPRQCLRQLRRLRHGNGSAEFAWNSCAIRAYAGCSNWEQLKVLGMSYIIMISVVHSFFDTDYTCFAQKSSWILKDALRCLEWESDIVRVVSLCKFGSKGV